MDTTRTVKATKPTRDAGRTWDRRGTDGRTDERSETNIPPNNIVVRGYNYRNWGRISIRCSIHKRHPIACAKIDHVTTALHCISLKTEWHINHAPYTIPSGGCLPPQTLSLMCFILTPQDNENKTQPISSSVHILTHWGRVTHICISKLTIIDSDNGLLLGRRQAIILTNAGILLIGPLGTNFSGILIKIHTFSFKKKLLKVSSAKWRPFCLGLNVLSVYFIT